jgi:hypothetical protein
MNDTNQGVNSTGPSSRASSDREFKLKMADDIWIKVKGFPIPDCYSEEDRLGIYERYYHRAVSMSQGE